MANALKLLPRLKKLHPPNVMQVMMLFQQVKDRAKAAQDRAKTA